jgi:hypothetical protein
MSALMEVSRLVSQDSSPPEVFFMQDDSFSKKQATPQENKQELDLRGKFIQPYQESRKLTSTVHELNAGFVVRTNRRELLDFVDANGLTHVLLQSEKHLEAAFGKSAVKTLNIIEDEEHYKTLFCYVTFPGTLADAQMALHSFDRDWWLRNSRRFGSKLNFDFELV